MEKRTHWPFSVRNFPTHDEIHIEPFEIDPEIVKTIYEHLFYGKPNYCPMVHLNKFNEKCKLLRSEILIIISSRLKFSHTHLLLKL
jgi:hypothetical protein